jgi:hypothetical protein
VATRQIAMTPAAQSILVARITLAGGKRENTLQKTMPTRGNASMATAICRQTLSGCGVINAIWLIDTYAATAMTTDAILAGDMEEGGFL